MIHQTMKNPNLEFRYFQQWPPCEPWGQDEWLKAIENLNNGILKLLLLKDVKLSIYLTGFDQKK